MIDSLHIIHGDMQVGRLDYDRKNDAISLAYEESWQFGSDGFPMSLSLPLAKQVHPDERIRPFLQGLLPDNPAVIEAWGKRFQVSPRNPFDLIKHVGEDCAGALQFVRPERLSRILSGELDALVPLTEADIAKRMEDLHTQARSIPTQLEGRFSLAGAQTKDALHLKDGHWFVPSGRIPSTHILKPEPRDLDHLALNEHFCLQLAAKVGIIRAGSEILEIGGRSILCVKRYDRTVDARGIMTRVHQEDTCQATGRYPNQKYQSDGGPSAAEIVKLLERFSDDATDDVLRFIMALAFNWVIAGTDAHSKNYSILHAPGSYVRLAPLYDLASYLPYQADPNSRKVKLAMKVGGTYRLHEIDAERWDNWLDEAGLSASWRFAAISLVAEEVVQKVDVVRELLAVNHDGPFIHQLADAILARARKCLEALA